LSADLTRLPQKTYFRAMRMKLAVTAVLLLLFAILRIWRLTSYGLYGDEPFAVYLANHSWSELFAAVIRDVVHPPLFYSLLKLWVGSFGDSLIAVKLFAVFFAISSIVPLIMVCRELRLSIEARNLFLWLVAVNAFLVFYSQELRMYSLLMVASGCVLLLFVKLLGVERQAMWKVQAALFAANLVLIYSHYFGWMFVAVQFIVLLLQQREKLKAFSAMCALLVTCFLPWAYLVAQAAKMKGGLAGNLSWNQRPGIKDLLWYFINLNGAISYRWEGYGFAYKILLGVYLVLTLFLIYALFRYAKNITRNAALLAILLFAVAPPMLAFAASYLLPQSIWGIRFLVLSAAPYLLFLTLAVLNLESQKLRKFVVLFLILWTGLSGYTELANREKLNVEKLVKEMMQAEVSQQQPIRIYTDNGLVGNTMQFYLDRFHEPRFEIVYVDNFEAIEDEYYWLAFLKYRFDNHPLVQDEVAAKGSQIERFFQTASPGHTVILFAVRR